MLLYRTRCFDAPSPPFPFPLPFLSPPIWHQSWWPDRMSGATSHNNCNLLQECKSNSLHRIISHASRYRYFCPWAIKLCLRSRYTYATLTEQVAGSHPTALLPGNFLLRSILLRLMPQQDLLHIYMYILIMQIMFHTANCFPRWLIIITCSLLKNIIPTCCLYCRRISLECRTT